MIVRRGSAENCGTRWRVLELVAGGEGLARLSDGRVAFVPSAVPGDEVEPLQVEVHKGHVRAKRFRLVHPGPNRVQAACPIAERCGGCDWMHVSRGAELEAKARLVSESLRRVGKLSPPPIDVVTAGPELGYRSRARFHIDETGEVGFFARGSHDLVDVRGCLACHPAVEAALHALKRVAPERLSPFSAVEVRRAPLGAKVVLCFHPRVRGELPDAASAALEELGKEYGVHLAGTEPAESTWQRFPLASGVELFASPECFTQVNLDVNERLVESVLQGVRRRQVTSCCDLYAGAGNFTLPLLASGYRVVAVEHNGAAVQAGSRAARAQGLAEQAFVHGDVTACVRNLANQGLRFDLVLLDPPRSGAPSLAPLVARLEPKYVLFCGCDPATFARDVSAFVRLGYEIEEVRVFDMFPRTHHVEAVAWMKKS